MIKSVINLSNVTRLTGGLPEDLDSIVTIDGSYEEGDQIKVYLLAEEVDLLYRFTAGSLAENVPWVVRPNDFLSGAYEFYWKLISISKQGLPAVWNADQLKFHQIGVINAPGTESVTVYPGFDL